VTTVIRRPSEATLARLRAETKPKKTATVRDVPAASGHDLPPLDSLSQRRPIHSAQMGTAIAPKVRSWAPSSRWTHHWIAMGVVVLAAVGGSTLGLLARILDERHGSPTPATFVQAEPMFPTAIIDGRDFPDP
jgi:hypothetical protein